MTEERVVFLYNAQSKISPHQGTNLILKSHYLLRCQEITKGYGLPKKQFTEESRCSHCLLQWSIGQFETQISPCKLSKKQRHRLRRKHSKVNNKGNVTVKSDNLHSNQINRICLFCNKSTSIKAIKPVTAPRVINCMSDRVTQSTNKIIITQDKKSNKTVSKHVTKSYMYSQSKDVFSLQNNNNNILSKSKEINKVITNNKRKKDKFAGLCKEAVLASAKLKKQKDCYETNNLNLFLKPSI